MPRLTRRASVAYTAVNKKHVEKAFALNLSTLKSPSYVLKLPNEAGFPRLPASDLLVMNLKHSLRVHGLRNEACRSLIIMEYLKEAVIQVGNDNLHVIPQSRESWDAADHLFNGVVDYSVATEDLESQLLVVEVKDGWNSQEAQWQVLAQAGSLLRRRLKDKKKTPVMAVLTNAEIFQFFAIDDRDSTVYSSRVIHLDYRANQELKVYDDLKEVVTWFRWFLTVITSMSPSYMSKRDRCSHLQQFRSNFKLGYISLCCIKYSYSYNLQKG